MLPENQNENRITIGDKSPKVNRYYLALSGRFKIAKYVSVCFLVVFLLMTVILFRDEITVENLRYLFKDLEMGDSLNLSSGDSISYDADAQLDLALYKGDLVVAGSSYFYLCDLHGNKRLYEDSVFTNPVALPGDKYLLVYGLSEYTYTLYNTFSKLHTETFDYPITGAAVSDKGTYAIVTRTAEYRSVVYLYNSGFERIGAVYKDKYVIDVAFNKDGTEVLITSLFSKDGSYCTELMNYVLYSQTPSSVKEVDRSMALKTGYNSNGGYSVFYSDRVEFYDREFVLRNTYNYPAGIVPAGTAVSDKYTLLTFSENIVGNNMKILAFDSEGNIILECEADGQPKKIQSYKDSIFVLLDGKVCCVNAIDGKVDYYETKKNSIDLLVVNEKTVLVCFSDGTSKITVE